MFRTGWSMSKFAVDLIEELKLRRWARLNYRRLESWDASLDPIVLDELQTIQRESNQREAEQLAAEQSAKADLMPLDQPATEIFGCGIVLRKSA